MMRRYQVYVERPVYAGFWHLCPSRSFSTLANARRFAEKVLQRRGTQATKYSRIRMVWGACIRDRKTGRVLDTIDAPVEIVPSVGEVGYW